MPKHLPICAAVRQQSLRAACTASHDTRWSALPAPQPALGKGFRSMMDKQRKLLWVQTGDSVRASAQQAR